MSAPGAVSQLCALVWYAQDFANVNNTPNIGIYAMCSPADALTAGITMQVERCTGALCTIFTFIGSSNGVQFATSPAPQAEYVDFGVYGTIYKYRVRFVNNDGPGPYSSIIQIDTTTHGASVCDNGVVADFEDQLNASGLRKLVESSLVQVQSTGLRKSVEWGLTEVRSTGLREIFEHGLKQVQATGLRIIIEYRIGPPVEPPGGAGESQLIFWY